MVNNNASINHYYPVGVTRYLKLEETRSIVQDFQKKGIACCLVQHKGFPIYSVYREWLQGDVIEIMQPIHKPHLIFEEYGTPKPFGDHDFSLTSADAWDWVDRGDHWEIIHTAVHSVDTGGYSLCKVDDRNTQALTRLTNNNGTQRSHNHDRT